LREWRRMKRRRRRRRRRRRLWIFRDMRANKRHLSMHRYLLIVYMGHKA
jgi:hypothetical protein